MSEGRPPPWKGHIILLALVLLVSVTACHAQENKETGIPSFIANGSLDEDLFKLLKQGTGSARDILRPTQAMPRITPFPTVTAPKSVRVPTQSLPAVKDNDAGNASSRDNPDNTSIDDNNWHYTIAHHGTVYKPNECNNVRRGTGAHRAGNLDRSCSPVRNPPFSWYRLHCPPAGQFPCPRPLARGMVGALLPCARRVSCHSRNRFCSRGRGHPFPSPGGGG